MKITTLKCKRCGHEWVPRKLPVRICPNRSCHTLAWDEPQTPLGRAAAAESAQTPHQGAPIAPGPNGGFDGVLEGGGK